MPVEKWTDIKNAILESIKPHISDFLDSNKNIEKLINERVDRLAKLTYLYSIAAEGPGRDNVLDQIKTVKQTLDNEISAMLLNATGSGGELLKKLLSVIFDIAIKAVPAIVSKI